MTELAKSKSKSQSQSAPRRRGGRGENFLGGLGGEAADPAQASGWLNPKKPPRSPRLRGAQLQLQLQVQLLSQSGGGAG
jgi:hypothetical protein